MLCSGTTSGIAISTLIKVLILGLKKVVFRHPLMKQTKKKKSLLSLYSGQQN